MKEVYCGGDDRPRSWFSNLKFQANFAASSFCFPCYGWVYEQNHGYILFINVVTKNTLVYRI